VILTSTSRVTSNYLDLNDLDVRNMTPL